MINRTKLSTVQTGEESGIKYWIRQIVNVADQYRSWYLVYILWQEKPEDLAGFLSDHEVTFCHPARNVPGDFGLTPEEKASGQIIGWDYMDHPSQSEEEVLDDTKFEIRRLLSNRAERRNREANPEHYAVEEVRRHLGLSLSDPRTAVNYVGRLDESAPDDGKFLVVEGRAYDRDNVVQIECEGSDLTVIFKDGTVRKQEVSEHYDQCPDGFICYSSGGYGDNESYLFRADLVRITGSGDSFRIWIPGLEEHAQDCFLSDDPYDDTYSEIIIPDDIHQVLRERGYGNLVDLEETDDEFYKHSVYANTEQDALWVNFPMEGENREDRLCVSRFQLSQVLFLKYDKEKERLTLYFRDGSHRSTETGLDLEIGALDCPFVSFGEGADEAFWARPEDVALGIDDLISIRKKEIKDLRIKEVQ